MWMHHPAPCCQHPYWGLNQTSDFHCLPSRRLKYGTSDISPQSARRRNPTLGKLTSRKFWTLMLLSCLSWIADSRPLRLRMKIVKPLWRSLSQLAILFKNSFQMPDVLVDNLYRGAWNSSFRWKLPRHHTNRSIGTRRRRYSNWPLPCILYHSVTQWQFTIVLH